RGVVSQTSLLANSAIFEESLAALRARPALRVGVHLNLTDGLPICPREQVPTLVTQAGEFAGGRHFMVSARLLSGRTKRDEVRAEWRAQLTRIVEAGITIRHLDGHGHMHLHPSVHEIVCELMNDFAIDRIRLISSEASLRGRVLGPLSHRLLTKLHQRGIAATHPARVLGLAGTGHLTATRLRRELSQRWSGEGELVTHPALGANARHRAWGFDGESEISGLLDPEVAQRLQALSPQRKPA
ncbi:MAG: ChbG/HpnK family deacetylase, partial [Deltaproteobacteria bacterium]|nr:ChbG/HpnK family deacetylase [Deltaproteobacteria bacterium]